MRPYLQGLLTRMAAKCTEPDSSKSVSWVAHREAERLNDLTMVDELSEHLQAEQVRQRRLACLFIIGKLGANQAHYDCAEIILAALAQEQDKYVLSAALDLIRDIPKRSRTAGCHPLQVLSRRNTSKNLLSLAPFRSHERHGLRKQESRKRSSSPVLHPRALISQ